VKTQLGGKNQFTVRVGGDYNLLPGLLALRAGLSYETRGQQPAMLNVLNYMLSRYGVHAGLTVRVAGKTDISFGYAHFIHENVQLQVFNGSSVSTYPPRYRLAQYHFKAGAGVSDAMGNGANSGGFSGVAGVEVPNGEPGYEIGPYFVNAGSYYFHLDVVSLSFTQHF
jgi:long-subunit fatty acid transport protein